MNVLETGRLTLRRITPDDAPFILELLNDPDWIRYIGDRGVRTVEGAREYIEKGPVASYARNGFGLWLTVLRDSGVPIGICGLIKRDTLEDVDVGFAFLPAFRGQGYALEAASATMEYGRGTLGLTRIVAITVPDNQTSIRLLEKVGFRFERMIRWPDDDTDLSLYATVGDATRNNESARGVVLTPSGHVLLMKIAGYNRELWITPGGRIRPGEEPLQALMRELEEETGIAGFRPGAEIWVRHATFMLKGKPLEEREYFFLVPSERFTPTTDRMEPYELEEFKEFRWWSVEEIVESGERFAPRRLGELLVALRRDGPPTSPVETGA